MSRLSSFGNLVAPPEILAGVRAIDPTADVIHLGGVEWMLGVRKPNDAARAEVEKQLKTIVTTRNNVVDAADRARVDLEMAKELQLLQLFADGLRPIHIYHVGKGQEYTSLHEIVSDFRERDFNWRMRADAAFKEYARSLSIDEADAERTKTVLAKIQADARSMFRHVIKKARSFVVQGLRPSRRPSSSEATS